MSLKTSFIFNQKLLIVSLIIITVVGTTYYWLDNRKDVYQPLWVMASGFWFITIIIGISLVIKKIRIGYMISGLLAWTTFAFWILDNYSFVFHKSLIASEPSMNAIIRNFIGAAFAILAIIASHNGFHKITSYQNKDRPA